MVVYRVFRLQVMVPIRSGRTNAILNGKTPNVESSGKPPNKVVRPVEEGKGRCEEREVEEEVFGLGVVFESDEERIIS